MKWTDDAWKTIEPIYNKILKLPFITDLIEGTLEKERFLFYIEQDALYLAEYGRVLTGIASKLKASEHIEAFIKFSGDTIFVENTLHQSFLKERNIKNIKPSPSCLLYTSYLFGHLSHSPVEVLVAAVLPCFWIYNEIGNYILVNQTKSKNPYQDWIDTYGSEDFEKSVTLAISICNELSVKCTPEQKEAMKEAFVMCSKFEWMLWDSAYNMEKWKI